MDGNQVVARARSLIGTRFRSQGRLAAVGLDCVGTVRSPRDVMQPG